MNSEFSRCLSLLRQEKGASQRAVASDLGISQALLSHYENGVREPGLVFVTRACDYYNVSADFLLGRTMARDGTTIQNPDNLYDYSLEKDNVLRGSVLATLSKRLLMNSVGLLFDLLGKTGRRDAIRTAADYLGTAIYKLFRHLYRADGTRTEDFFSISPSQFLGGAISAELFCCESQYVEALATHIREKGEFSPMTNQALMRDYPGQYQSLLQVIHVTDQRVCLNINMHNSENK